MILRELTVPDRPHLRVLRETTSTNDDAREWAAQQAVDGATVVADHQTAGRGRVGRDWFSPPGCNLYLSQVLRAPANRLRLVPLLGALAVRETIAACLSSVAGPPAKEDRPRPRVKIKWPNDILVRNRKVAGILCEMIQDPAPAGILGIGVNLNLAARDLPEDLAQTATSLSILMGQEINRRDFLQTLLEQLDTWRDHFHQKPEELVSAFIPHCLTLGQSVQVAVPGREVVYGTARSIDSDGLLLVEDESGELTRIEAGDVAIVTAP